MRVLGIFAGIWRRSLGLFALGLCGMGAAFLAALVGAQAAFSIHGSSILDDGRISPKGVLILGAEAAGPALIIASLVAATVGAALATMANDNLAGQQRSWWTATRLGMRRALSLFGAGLLAGVAVVALVIVSPLIWVASMLALALTPVVCVVQRRRDVTWPQLSTLLIGAVPFGVVAMWLVRWSLFVPVASLEHHSPRRALQRSSDLVRGSWTPVAAALAAIAVSYVAPQLLAQMLSGNNGSARTSLIGVVLSVVLVGIPVTALVALFRRLGGDDCGSRGKFALPDLPDGGFGERPVINSTALMMSALLVLSTVGLVSAPGRVSAAAGAQLYGYSYDDDGSHPTYVRFGPGVAGSFVELLDATGTPTGDSTETNADGYFQFDVADGDYIIAFSPPGGRVLSPKSTAEAAELRQFVPVDPTTGRTDIISVTAGDSVEADAFLEVDDTPLQTTTTVSSSGNGTSLDSIGAVVDGESVTILVNVAAPGVTPTGEVHITIGANPPVAVPLDYGNATLIHQFTVGDTTVTVDYPGDITRAASSDTYIQHVLAKTTATLGYGQAPTASYGAAQAYVRATSDGSDKNPTGDVCVVVDAVPFCTSTASFDGGYATVTLPPLALGTHNLEFQYTGDRIHERATWSGVIDVVASTPTVTLTVPTNASAAVDAVFGESITVTANVRADGAGFDLDGTVTFINGDTTIGTAVVAGGHDVNVTAAVTPIQVGDLSIVATFESSNPGFLSVTSPAKTVRVGIAGTSTTLTLSERSTVGDSVTFTATVAGIGPSTAIPAGAVRIREFNGATLGVVELDETGSATLTVDGIAHGRVTYEARFEPGDGAQYGWSSATRTHTVDRFTPTLAASSSRPGGVAVGNATVTYTATVTGVAAQAAPGGQVIFSGAFGTRTATIDTSGIATATVTFPLGATGDQIVAIGYQGDDTYTDRAVTLVQVVTLATANVSLSESVMWPLLGEAQTMTVSVTGFTAPQGTITLYDGTVAVGTATLTAVGTTTSRVSFPLAAATQTGGDHIFTAQYNPTANFVASTGTKTITVRRGTVNVAATSQRSLASSTATDVSVTITTPTSYEGFTPTGTVAFYEGSTLLATAPVTATFSSARWSAIAALELAPGFHNVEVRYVGDTNFATNSTYVSVVRRDVQTALSLNAQSTAGGGTTLAVLVEAKDLTSVTTANPLTGVVRFTVDGTVLGEEELDSRTTYGVASIQVPAYTLPFTQGTHTVTADFRHTPTSAISSTATKTVTTAPAELGLKIVADRPVYGQPVDVRLEWDVQGPPPTGKFRITSGRRSCTSSAGGTVWTSSGSTRTAALPATDHCEMMFDNSNISFANGSWAFDVTATYLDPDVVLQPADPWRTRETVTTTLVMHQPATVLSMTKLPAVTLSTDNELSFKLVARFPNTAPRPADGYVFAPKRADGRFDLQVPGFNGLVSCTPTEVSTATMDLPTPTRVNAARSTCSAKVPDGFFDGRDQLSFTGTYTGDTTYAAADATATTGVSVCSALSIAPAVNGTGRFTSAAGASRCPAGLARSGERVTLDTTPDEGWIFAWWEQSSTDCSTNPCTTTWTPRRELSNQPGGLVTVAVTDLDREFRPVFAQDCVTVILAEQYVLPAGWSQPSATETVPRGELSCVERTALGVLTTHRSYEPVQGSATTTAFDQAANVWAPEELDDVGPTAGNVITSRGVITHVPRGTTLDLVTRDARVSAVLYGRTTVVEAGYGNADRCYGTTCPVLTVRRNAGAGNTGQPTFDWATPAATAAGDVSWSITPTNDVTTLVSVYGPDCYNVDVNVAGPGSVRNATPANCRINSEDLFAARTNIDVVVGPNPGVMAYVTDAECAPDSPGDVGCSRVDSQATPTSAYTSKISDRIESDQTIEFTFTTCTALTVDVRGLGSAAAHSPGNCPAEPKTPAQVAVIDAAAVQQRFFDRSADFDHSMPTEPVQTVTGDDSATILYERGTNVFVSAKSNVSPQGGLLSSFVDWGTDRVTGEARPGAASVGSLVMDVNATISPSFARRIPCDIRIQVTTHDGIAALDPASDRPELQCANSELIYSDRADFEARADNGGTGVFARPVNGTFSFDSYTDTNAIPGWTYIVETDEGAKVTETTKIGASVDIRVPSLPRVDNPIVRGDGSVDPRTLVDVELAHCVIVRPDINLIGVDGLPVPKNANGTFNDAYLDNFQFTSTDVDPNCPFLPAQPAWALGDTVMISATRSPGLDLISWTDANATSNRRGAYPVTLDGASSVVDVPATFQVTCFTLNVAGAWPDEAPVDAWPSDPAPLSEDALFIGDVSPRPNCPGADPSEHRYIGGTPVTVQRMGLGRLERFSSWSGDVVDTPTMLVALAEFSAQNPGYELRDVGTRAADYVNSVSVDPVEFAYFDSTLNTTTVVMNKDRSVVANYRHTDSGETWEAIGEVAAGTLALVAKTAIESVPPFSAISMVMSLMNELGDPWNTASQSWDLAFSPLTCAARSGLASNTERLPSLTNRAAAAPDQTADATLSDAQFVVGKVGTAADKLEKVAAARVKDPTAYFTPTGTKKSAYGSGAESYNWDANTSVQRMQTAGKVAGAVGDLADVVSFGIDVAGMVDADSVSIEDCMAGATPDIAIIMSCGLPQTGEIQSESERHDYATYLDSVRSGQANCPDRMGVPTGLTGMAAWDFVWTSMRCELPMPTSGSPDRADDAVAAITLAQTMGCPVTE